MYDIVCLITYRYTLGKFGSKHRGRAWNIAIKIVPGGISEIGHATSSQLSLGPCVVGQANSRCYACAAKANGLSHGLRVRILSHAFGQDGARAARAHPRLKLRSMPSHLHY